MYGLCVYIEVKWDFGQKSNKCFLYEGHRGFFSLHVMFNVAFQHEGMTRTGFGSGIHPLYRKTDYSQTLDLLVLMPAMGPYWRSRGDDEIKKMQLDVGSESTL